MLSDFFSLLYPKLCSGCGKSLMKSETAICTECRYELPFTKFHSLEDNAVTKTFWGRVPLEFGISLIEFNKGHRIQNILHELKYNSNTQVGQELGRMIGYEMKEHPKVDIDVLIPVPLHPRKLKKRGYNQAEVICEGIAEVTGLPVESKALKRRSYTKTQTSKGRMDRWANVESVFALENPDLLIEQHVLLVDDVVTTGATLEACANQVLKGPVKKISIATAACVI